MRFLIGLFLLILSAQAYAQEVTAARPSHTARVAETAFNKAMLTNLQRIFKCNQKRMFYIPDDANADSDGCASVLPTCNDGEHLQKQSGDWACTSVSAVPTPKSIGKLGKDTEKNLGSDWDLILLEGSYASSDNGPCGGFISKALNKAALTSATGGEVVFDLSSNYRCSWPGHSKAEFCVKLKNNGDIVFRSKNLVSCNYITF